MKEEIDFTCPYCKNEFNIDIYPVINLQSESELYEDLFNLDLFKIECKQCEHSILLEYPMFIVDSYKKYIIALAKDVRGLTCPNELMSKLNHAELKYARVVYSLAELREKLLIFEYDLNDRIINLLKKYILDNNIIEKEFTTLNFERIDKQDLIFVAYKLGDDSSIKELSINFTYYNKIIDDLHRNSR